MNLPTELLRTFTKAVDLGSFTRAGDAVGRTQSAVSLQMRRLEEMLDTQLVERGTHRVKLTEEGATLASYARRMLALNDEAVASLQRPRVADGIQGLIPCAIPRTGGRRLQGALCRPNGRVFDVSSL